MSHVRLDIIATKQIMMGFAVTSILLVLSGLVLCSQPWWVSAPLLVALVFIATARWRNYGTKVYGTLRKDIRFLRSTKKIVDKVNYHTSCRHGIGDIFADVVKRHPTKTAIIFEEQKWSFQELEDMSNKVANFFKATGLQPGKTVALFAHNCPQFVACLMGLGKIGVEVALISTSARCNVLTYSINLVDCCLVLFDASLCDALNDVRSELGPSLLARSYCIDGESALEGSVSLETELDGVSSDEPPPYENKSSNDILCYMYTSGTTGFPKACRIKHSKFFFSGQLMGQMGVTVEDIVYNTLPLCHSTGGALGLGCMLFKGCTFVLKKKFSACRYWSDAVKYNCTVVMYISDMCRYLLAQPQRETDTQHKVRVAFGNGLRAEIWDAFKSRFRIDTISECYGCTEGNVGFMNQFNKPGSCGRAITTFPLPGLPKPAFVKFDHSTGEALRNSRGFCSIVGRMEPGLLVSPITKTRKFDGYHNHEASQKKILRDVFKKGDCYFNSGDLFQMDEEGFLYYYDRIGDIYHWDGKIVSSMAVEALISIELELRDVAVYGVQIQGMDGRAGMAAIAGGEESVDLDALVTKLFLLLPPYAVPRFLRFIGSTEILTRSYKLKKVKLRDEGFDLTKVSDAVYMLDLSEKRYVPFTQELQEKLLQEVVSL